MPLTYLTHTFGCKLNFSETATIARMLEERGLQQARKGDHPDIVVVNTCSVTGEADKKCRQTIRAIARRHPHAAIAVTGCYVQLHPEEASSLPGVVVTAGIDRKLQIAGYLDRWLAERQPTVDVNKASLIKDFAPSCSRGDRTRWFLKVQDGCDYYCSYCTIPMARGRSRSASVHAVVDKARQAADSGAKEIVITGVNIGDFGKGSSENFFDLIKALEQVNGIERYRISSIEPNLLTDEIIEWVSKSRNFMPHFHIPLQCGDDEVLKLMRRHYDTTLFRHRVETINRLIPDAFIGVDLIVGARGETPERFESSREFVESLDISRLHVFPYSERPGTKALEITPVVENSVRHDRVKTMLAISDDKLSRFTSRFIGTVRPVLLEHSQKDGFMHGFTDNYIKVKVPAVPKLANRIVEVRLDSVDGEEVNATIIG